MPPHGYFYSTTWCYTRNLSSTRSYTKITDSWQTRSSAANAENWSFCKRISKWLSNGKAPKHETDIFTQVRGLLYKHVTDSGQKFLALVIPKSWRYMVLVEAHNKLSHDGNTHTYCLIKCHYYWKGMNKDIKKYIANCTLCHKEKAKIQTYPLHMTDIPDRPFDKIAINLVMECETSTSGNKHILIIIDHLTRWPEAFPILDKSADTIVSTFINQYLPAVCVLGTSFGTTVQNLKTPL